MEPIVQRILSYQKVFSKKIKDITQRAFFFIRHINQYLLLNFKKIKYNFEFRRECYYLGKYLSNLNDDKYDLSHDRIFIDYIDNIKNRKELIDKNKDNLSILSVKQKENI